MAYTSINGRLVKVAKKQHGIAVPSDWPPAGVRRPEPDAAPKLAADKGEYGGSCNITRCQRPNSATWFNHSTRKYYCRSCAHDLNYDTFNCKDAMDMWGHLLCTEGVCIEGDYPEIHAHYRALYDEKHNQGATS